MSPRADDIWSSLLRDIATGAAPSGSWLPREVDLADGHAVSRTTARVALARAADRGLVEIRHGRGQRVRDESDWDLGYPDVLTALVVQRSRSRLRAEVIDVRERIERPLVVSLAAADFPLEDVLAPLLASLRDAQSGEGSTATTESAEVQLHDAIVTAAGGPVLAAVLRPVHVSLAGARAALASRRLRAHVRHHEAIVGTILAGDVDGVEAATDAHLAALRDWLT